MSAPNVELLDYNWGYRKLAVANVKIAELEAKVAELERKAETLVTINGVLQKDNENLEAKVAEQAVTIAELTAKAWCVENMEDILRQKNRYSAECDRLEDLVEQQATTIAELRSEIEQADQALKYARSERDCAKEDHRAVADMNRDKAATIERLTEELRPYREWLAIQRGLEDQARRNRAEQAGK